MTYDRSAGDRQFCTCCAVHLSHTLSILFRFRLRINKLNEPNGINTPLHEHNEYSSIAADEIPNIARQLVVAAEGPDLDRSGLKVALGGGAGQGGAGERITRPAAALQCLVQLNRMA